MVNEVQHTILTLHKIRSITESVGNFSLTDVRMLQES